MNLLLWIAIGFVSAWLLAYLAAPLYLWTIAVALVVAAYGFLHGVSVGYGVIAVLWALLAIALNVPLIRRKLVSDRLLEIFREIMPTMSATEREAMDAGTVWWDADLFSGRPSWKKLLAVPAPKLSDEEQAFIDGPTEELCHLTDDWQITHELQDLPPEVWRFIREQGFLGMIIPKQYGGLGF